MRKNNPVIENILNSFNSGNPSDIIQKGAKAELGEIRVWKGEKWMKTERPTNNGWVLMSKLDASDIARLTGTKEDISAPVPTHVPTSNPDPIDVDINKRFAAFARFTKAVIQGAAKSMIAYGTGGVGKTWTVQNQLKIAGKTAYNEEIHQPAIYDGVAGDGEEDAEIDLSLSSDYDYVKITGKSTAPQVYKALYEHNGKVIIFDDCDGVLTDTTAVNLFKGALDTTGDGTIAYGTSAGIKDDNGDKLPKRFKFNGQVIFISNLPSNVVPQPIKSRALRVDLSMTPEQTIERIRFIAKDKSGQYTNLDFGGISYTSEDMESIIDYLDEHKHDTTDLNVRTIGSILAIKKIADAEGEEWREDADHMIFSKGEETEKIESKGVLNKGTAIKILGIFEDDILEKGKKAAIGEVRVWNGEKQQKQADGTWKKISDGKSKSGSEHDPINFPNYKHEELRGMVWSDIHEKVKSFLSGRGYKVMNSGSDRIDLAEGGRPKYEEISKFLKNYGIKNKISIESSTGGSSWHTIRINEGSIFDKNYPIK